jgi:hypothetical protein
MAYLTCAFRREPEAQETAIYSPAGVSDWHARLLSWLGTSPGRAERLS